MEGRGLTSKAKWEGRGGRKEKGRVSPPNLKPNFAQCPIYNARPHATKLSRRDGRVGWCKLGLALKLFVKHARKLEQCYSTTDSAIADRDSRLYIYLLIYFIYYYFYYYYTRLTASFPGQRG